MPGRTSLVGPRSFTTDASVMKNFGLTERFNLQFRMDMFNLFNHPVLGFNSNQGNTCIDCSGSGLVTNIDGNTSMRAIAVRSPAVVLGRVGQSTVEGANAPSILSSQIADRVHGNQSFDSTPATATSGSFFVSKSGPWLSHMQTFASASPAAGRSRIG